MSALVQKGDWDGFVAAFINNLVQLLILTPLCLGVLGFSPELVLGRILPGVAFSFLVGNLYYAYLAWRLEKRGLGKKMTALPYGISTPAVFANVFLVMLPAKMIAEQNGLDAPETVAWRAGLLACAMGGVIEVAGAFCAARLRKMVPRVALLSSLAGVGLGFLGLAFLFQLMQVPQMGIPMLFVSLLLLLRPFALPTWLPATGIILLLGTGLGWIFGLAPVSTLQLSPLESIAVYMPGWYVSDILLACRESEIMAIISVVLPISLLGVIASLQNIESAAAAGDVYPERPCLLVNGIGSLAAAFFGSPFPTSIYIGHPAWKEMGAQKAYSVLNGVAITAICLSGFLGAVVWMMPVEAGISIIFWIGLIIVTQSFATSPREHIPAVVVGVLPGFAAWVIVLINGLLIGAAGSSGGNFRYDEEFLHVQAQFGNFLGGGIALQQGFLLVAMIWSSITVFVIERKFRAAVVACLLGAGLSAIGLMHGFTLRDGAVLVDIPLLQSSKEAWLDWIASPQETLGYLLAALALGVLGGVLPDGKGASTDYTD